MPYVRNDNAHGVRVGNTRVPANSVAQVPEDDAKTFDGYTGCSKVSDAEGRKAVEGQSSNPDAHSPSAENEQYLSDLRVAHRAAAVSAPLQVVRGDDDAPLGPPSGVITTKQAVAKDGSEAERRAFADHEYDEVPEGASEIEQKQAQATREVEEVAQGLAERLQGDAPADADEE